HPWGHDTLIFKTISVPASTSVANGRLSDTVVGCWRTSASARSMMSLMPRLETETASADLRRARRGPSGVKSREAPGDEVSAESMLGQAAHGLSSSIETRDDLAEDVDHLLV